MFKINSLDKNLHALKKVSYADLGYRERYDIQEWIALNPQMLGEDLLILQKEFSLKELEYSTSPMRIDLLALDVEGNLVVIELKRDDSGRHAEWQAIKYASLIANMTVSEVYTELAKYQNVDIEFAKKIVEDFLGYTDGWLEVDDVDEILNKKQRIILVANDFHPDAVSAVLWLIDSGIDISCIKLTPYADEEHNLFLSPVVMIPLPEAKDYLRRKEAKVQQRVSAANTISFEKSAHSAVILKSALLKTLTRDSPLTPRLLAFLDVLLTENRVFNRDEIKDSLFQKGIGEHIGQTGRYMSNISQFLTNPANSHLRQVIEFESENQFAGAQKDTFLIIEEYRDVVKEVLDELV